MSNLNSVVQRGLDYLRSNQLPTGEIKCFYSTHPRMLEDCNADSSPFPTALLAYSLSFCGTSDAHQIIQLAIKYLLSQMEPSGVWRYWTAVHPYYKYIPVDLDDTACASIVLKQNQVKFPNNRAVFLSSRSPQNLFYTWVTPHLRHLIKFAPSYLNVVLRQNPIGQHYFFKLHEAADRADVDGVVNANVLFYLGKSPEILPAVKYLIDIIKQGKESQCDKWHLSKFNFYYSLSRLCYAEMDPLDDIKDVIIDRIMVLMQEDGMIGESALDTGLAICSLLNLGVPVTRLEKSINALAREQRADGQWDKAIFYFGGPQYAGPDKYYGWGSDELTTGFCLEALVRYKNATNKSDFENTDASSDATLAV